jgi:non-heme chloroperoxidase
MPYIETEPGVNLFYQDRGRGPAIAFLHGWGGSNENWNYQVMDLADRHRCITIDLRGHGRSDSPFSAYDYDEHGRDLRAILTKLDLNDVTLVGWSMGGAIALKYVRDVGERVARLVLVGSVGPRFSQEPDQPFGLPAEVLPALLEAERTNSPDARKGLYDACFKDLEKWRNTATYFYEVSLQMPTHAGYRSFKAIADEDLRDGLERIRVPVHAFHGRHDATCDIRWVEWALGRIPSGGEMIVFEESAHTTFVEEREKFSRELARVASTATAAAV